MRQSDGVLAVQFGQHGQQQLAVLEPVEVCLLDVGFLRCAHDAYCMHHDSVERNEVWREVVH